MKNEKLSDLTKAIVGDKVWTLSQGWGVIESMPSGFGGKIGIKLDSGKFTCCDLMGRFEETDKTSFVFWDEVEIKAPPPPKRKTEKKLYIGLVKRKSDGLYRGTIICERRKAVSEIFKNLNDGHEKVGIYTLKVEE